MRHYLYGILAALVLLTTAGIAAETWKTVVDLDGRLIHQQESNLGNFVADAIRGAAKADVAVIQASAFQDDALIKAGLVDEETFRAKLTSPTSTVNTLRMRPAILKKMLERAVNGRGMKPYLQISGMTVTYDTSKVVDNRILEIVIGKKALDFNDEKTEVLVAMPEELAKGASGYSVVYPKEVRDSRTEIENQTIIDAIKAECIRLRGEIRTQIDGRLKDLAPKKIVVTDTR